MPLMIDVTPSLRATRIAYFSMEIGIRPEMHTYSGGLGILAGDAARSAADLGLPMVFVTLASRSGYLRQEIDSQGAQIDSPDPWNPEDYTLAVRAQIAARTRGPDHPPGHQRDGKRCAGPLDHGPALWGGRDLPHQTGDRSRHGRRASLAGARLCDQHLPLERGPRRVSGIIASAQVSPRARPGSRRVSDLRDCAGPRAMRLHDPYSYRGGT